MLLEREGFTETRSIYLYHPTDFSRSLLYLAEDCDLHRMHSVLSHWIRIIEIGLAAFLPLRFLAGPGAALHVVARRVEV
jgi:hypothetical protein